MPCEPIDFPAKDGFVSTGWICVSGTGIRRKRCSACGALCDRLCDIPVPGRGRDGIQKTCSAAVCARCSVRLGDDDVCPAHPVPAEALRCAREPVRRGS